MENGDTISVPLVPGKSEDVFVCVTGSLGERQGRHPLGPSVPRPRASLGMWCPWCFLRGKGRGPWSCPYLSFQVTAHGSGALYLCPTLLVRHFYDFFFPSQSNVQLSSRNDTCHLLVLNPQLPQVPVSMLHCAPCLGIVSHAVAVESLLHWGPSPLHII